MMKAESTFPAGRLPGSSTAVTAGQCKLFLMALPPKQGFAKNRIADDG
jgi:hypothetical protein